MKTSHKVTTAASLFAAAALTGMLAGSANASGITGVRGPGFGAATSSIGVLASGNGMFNADHHCKGMNTCKGKGGCKTAANKCAGKNHCKGKGGCNTIVPSGM